MITTSSETLFRSMFLYLIESCDGHDSYFSSRFALPIHERKGLMKAIVEIDVEELDKYILRM